MDEVQTLRSERTICLNFGISFEISQESRKDDTHVVSGRGVGLRGNGSTFTSKPVELDPFSEGYSYYIEG